MPTKLPAKSIFNVARNIALLERTSGGGRVDRANAVIYGVRILGPASANNRTYTEQAMQQAAKLCEGIAVNLDHPDRKTPGANRSVTDRVGKLVNVRYRDGAVFGDLALTKGHPYTEAILEMAEANERGVGLSHNAQGNSRPDPSRGGEIVESVTRVRSVDIVQNPATNSTFFEARARTHSPPATAAEMRSRYRSAAYLEFCNEPDMPHSHQPSGCPMPDMPDEKHPTYRVVPPTVNRHAMPAAAERLTAKTYAEQRQRQFLAQMGKLREQMVGTVRRK